MKKLKFALCNKAANSAETKNTPRYGPLPPSPGTGSGETQQYRSYPHLSLCSNPRRHAIIQQKILWRPETAREDSVHPSHRGFLQTPSEHHGIFMGENIMKYHSALIGLNIFPINQCCGSMPLTNGSGSGSCSGSCSGSYYPDAKEKLFFYGLLFEGTVPVYLHHFSKIKSHKELTKQGFLIIFA
jgi:hypothetical protein